jgi:hypothetical protein
MAKLTKEQRNEGKLRESIAKDLDLLENHEVDLMDMAARHLGLGPLTEARREEFERSLSVYSQLSSELHSVLST